MTDTIQMQCEDGIAHVILNRPRRYNTLNLEMAQALADTCKQIQNNQDIRCLIIEGRGGNFLAGGDVLSFKTAMDDNNEAYITELIKHANATVCTLRNLPVPVIACVEGAVAGYGLSLMLACDLVIAAENAIFISAYSQIGATPDGGMTYHLPRMIGLKKAFEICLLSDQINAQQALEIGIVNRLVPLSDLKGEVEKLAKRLNNGPVLAYSRIKRLLNESLVNDLDNQLMLEGDAFRAGFQSKEFQEGVTAFCEKRKPDFH